MADAIPYAITEKLARLTAVVLPQIPASATRDELVATLQAFLDEHASPPFTLALERLSADPMAAPAREAVVRCADSMGNVAFVRWTQGRGWACVLANGIPASMSYAGVPHGEEIPTVTALDRAKTVADVLRIMKARALQAKSVELEG